MIDMAVRVGVSFILRVERIGGGWKLSGVKTRIEGADCAIVNEQFLKSQQIESPVHRARKTSGC